MTEQQKLIASDAANADNLGGAVAVSGNTALLGTLGSDSAYVFTRSGTTWTEQQILVGSDTLAANRFGHSVALDGETTVISDPFSDDAGSSSGSVYVFTRSGTTWTEQQKLTAVEAAGNDFFGYGVDIDGETLIIGNPDDDDDGSGSGSAEVFTRTGITWTRQQELNASDAVVDDEFGISVAISGDTVVIGSLLDDDGIADAGSAYVFIRSGSTWTEQQKLTASDFADDAEFGLVVAIDGNTAVVADEEEGVYVYVALETDLSITKTTSPTEARVGQNLTYTLTVTNNGPADATSITVTDTLPGGVTFVSAPGCTGTTTITCTAASLLNGATVAFTITVTAPNVTGSISNTATVSAASPTDTNSSNDAVTLVTSVLGFPPVPAIGAWGLGALALAFGAFVFLARRRRAGTGVL